MKVTFADKFGKQIAQIQAAIDQGAEKTVREAGNGASGDRRPLRGLVVPVGGHAVRPVYNDDGVGVVLVDQSPPWRGDPVMALDEGQIVGEFLEWLYKHEDWFLQGLGKHSAIELQRKYFEGK